MNFFRLHGCSNSPLDLDAEEALDMFSRDDEPSQDWVVDAKPGDRLDMIVGWLECIAESDCVEARRTADAALESRT